MAASASVRRWRLSLDLAPQGGKVLRHLLSLAGQRGQRLADGELPLVGGGQRDLRLRHLRTDRGLFLPGVLDLLGQEVDTLLPLGTERFKFTGLVLGLVFLLHGGVDLGGEVLDLPGNQRPLAFELRRLLVALLGSASHSTRSVLAS